MRVLITGGAGFIGSNLADKLLADGDDVVVVDDLSTGLADSVPETAVLHVANVAEERVAGMIADAAPDAILHAAASYADPDDWERDARTNVLGTVNVVRGALLADARLVYLQTALCYGTCPDVSPVPLDAPVRPDSSYAISKTAAEQYVAQSGLDWVSLRLANCYGPRNLSGPVPTFFKRLSAGEPVYVADTRRDFVYVDDLLTVVSLALRGCGAPGAYHVSSGGDRPIADLLAAVADAMGIEAADVPVRPRTEGDAATILLDPTRTLEEFGWRARVPLEDGVPRAVAWYEEHGVAETYTHLKLAT